MENNFGSFTENYIDKQTAKILFNAGAGALTGSIEMIAFYPLDTFKIKRQLWDERPLRQILKDEGLGLYKGIDSAIYRNMIGSGILFGAYDMMIGLYGRPEKPSTTQHLAASTSAAVLSSLLTNPFDVVKTRMQAEKKKNVLEMKSPSRSINLQDESSAADSSKTQKMDLSQDKLMDYRYKNFFSTAREIMRKEGVSALGKGSVLKTIKAGPQLAAPLFLFNIIPQWWDERVKKKKLQEDTNNNSPKIKK
jgi:hypothetical protein